MFVDSLIKRVPRTFYTHEYNTAAIPRKLNPRKPSSAKIYTRYMVAT